MCRMTSQGVWATTVAVCAATWMSPTVPSTPIPRVGQDHRHMPAGSLGIEAGLVCRKAIREMITQKEVRRRLGLEGGDGRCRVCGHTGQRS